MSQAEAPLADNLGYVLKIASHALHTAMESALRPEGLTLPQYSCLEQLRRTPDLTNAQLARGTFVTPQSMNDVLRGLQRRGLVDRPAQAATGRSRPTRLTAAGRDAVARAHVALAPVERAMDAVAAAPEHARLLDGLRAVIGALDPGDAGPRHNEP